MSLQGSNIAAKPNRHLTSISDEANSNGGRYRKSIFTNRPTVRCKRCHQVLLAKGQRYNKCREQYSSLPLLQGTIWHYMQSLSLSSNN